MAFGDFSTFTEDLTQSTSAITGFTQKLRLTTPAVTAGDYRIGWSFTWGNDSAANSTRVKIEEDDITSLWEMYTEPKDGGADQKIPADGLAQRTLTAGIHTFDMDFATTAGGTARIEQARLEFWSVT